MKEFLIKKLGNINKKYLVILLVIVILLTGAGMSYGKHLKSQKEDQKGVLELQQGQKAAENPEANAKANKIYVHVVGEVENPGLVELDKGSRLAEAVDKTGVTAEADLSLVNLARILNDGEKVYIPNKSEAAALGDGENKTGFTMDGDASTSSAGIDANTNAGANANTGSNTKGSSSGSSSSSSGQSTVIKGPVNINTGDASELQRLNGVGPAKAQAIIEYRNQNGPFGSVDELINVSGIGEKTLDKIRSNATVN